MLAGYSGFDVAGAAYEVAADAPKKTAPTSQGAAYNDPPPPPIPSGSGGG